MSYPSWGDGMTKFFSELKRRHIYRVAAAYAVVAWVLLQLFNNLEPILKLPDWTGSLFLALLAAGFPVALLFAWIHHLAGTDGSAARPATGKLDWALIGALVVVIALMAYERLAPSSCSGSQQATIAAAELAPASPRTAIPIAVLHL